MGFSGELAFRDPSAPLMRTMFAGLRAAGQQIQASRSLLGAGEPQPDPAAGIGFPHIGGAVADDEYSERLLEPVQSIEPPPPPPPGAQVDLTASDYESLLAVSTPRRAPPTPPPEEEPSSRRHYGMYDTIYEQEDAEEFGGLDRDPARVTTSLLDPGGYPRPRR